MQRFQAYHQEIQSAAIWKAQYRCVALLQQSDFSKTEYAHIFLALSFTARLSEGLCVYILNFLRSLTYTCVPHWTNPLMDNNHGAEAG